MQVKIKEVSDLIALKFNNNQSQFAKTIGVDRSHVSKFLKTGTGAGSKFCGGLIAYCENEGLNSKDYILFP